MTTRIGWFLLPFAFAFLAPWDARSADKPNVIFIMADDLGHGHLGSYGQKMIKTPRIDGLAAEGMRFTNAYAGSAVCAPCRSVLMTGLHTGHTPVRNNGAGQRILDEDVTVAEVLKKAGYATGGFGKWGLGQEFTPGRAYDQGFDTWVGQYDQVHAHFFYPWFVWKNDQRILLEENWGAGGPDGRKGKGGQYVHDVVHGEAKAFIREHGEKGEPFFAYLAYIIPHVELTVPEEDELPYRDKGWPKKSIPDPRPGYLGSEDAYVTYAGMISRLDRHVGEVVDLVDELGLSESTLIIFTSDNGAQGGTWTPLQEFFGGSGGLRGLKGSLHEGGLRVPFIARWSGMIEAGTVSDHQTYFPDVMPTLSALAGADCPATDGLSLLPTFFGKKDEQVKHKYLYWELGRQVSVLSGKWKAVRPDPRKPWELYDLSADESETTDLAAKNPAELKRLTGYADEAHTERRTMPIIPRSNWRVWKN